MENYYSIADVAKNLNVSIKSIRRYIAAQTLPSVKVGNVYRIPESAIDGFLHPVKNKVEKAVQRKIIQKKVADDINWVDIASCWRNIKQSKMTFVDLFCGAGGLSKGL